MLMKAQGQDPAICMSGLSLCLRRPHLATLVRSQPVYSGSSAR